MFLSRGTVNCCQRINYYILLRLFVILILLFVAQVITKFVVPIHIFMFLLPVYLNFRNSKRISIIKRSIKITQAVGIYYNLYNIVSIII